MSEMPQDDDVGAWSADKLSLLGKYLGAYTTIMQGQEWCRNGYHYIDAFAGSGRARLRGAEEFIDGSPRVALSVRYPFTSYTFIEENPYRVESLLGLRDEFSTHDIRVREGDCNEIITNEIVTDIRFENFNRGIVFVDPYAMNVEWSTVESIAETRALEIFMNIPTMAINRTALLKNPYDLTEMQIERLNRFWGTDVWWDEFYQTVETLFGEMEIKLIRSTARRLGELYRGRLREVFEYVTSPLVMRNSRGVPIYCLVFAGHKQAGADIMTSIFSRYERLGV
jgi:three-Cys-motif partner protein